MTKARNPEAMRGDTCVIWLLHLRLQSTPSRMGYTKVCVCMSMFSSSRKLQKFTHTRRRHFVKSWSAEQTFCFLHSLSVSRRSFVERIISPVGFQSKSIRHAYHVRKTVSAQSPIFSPFITLLSYKDHHHGDDAESYSSTVCINSTSPFISVRPGSFCERV